ncbi:RNA-binding S4 domain-containing protein [Thermophagus xiamenensis]|uniref:Heat shock protein Hsp15 n=1 Tax=Thermophagus xiamenensis TaxID=385682 RepID=A0A1I2ARM1_9BACT|nr:RNA-binding S4 domain-containing protein [Thermophagus xiamenensis]SFE45540.1 heat shock protein Hsp15 [Thermophagus xiamenensis]
MSEEESVRIDKFLWAVRLFKTRSLAAEACKKGKVTIDNQPVKSSRLIRQGDKISIKIPPATKTYRVLQLSEKRMGAKLVPDFIEDITPPEEIELLEMARMAQKMNRPRGAGRPTKKERRELDNLQNGW